jgi:hypothetical protein
MFSFDFLVAMVLAIFAIAVIVVPWVVFALLDGFPRLRLHQIIGIVALVAWVFGLIAAAWGPFRRLEYLVLASAVVVLLCFAGMWSYEFRLLMARRAKEFPARFDKLAWVFVVTVMAPVGVWLFRSYRRVQWPECAKASRPHPLDEPTTGVDVSEMQRIGA